jgi:two-component system, OmpR family, response regulator VicR
LSWNNIINRIDINGDNHMGDRVFTTHQVAKECNVHHTTVINWINEDKLKAYTTPGGHRRVSEEDLVKFMKKYQIPIVGSLSGKSNLILVVDDDIEYLDEIKIALKNTGFEFDFASNGFEAGRKIYTNRPSLVLLDFKMPGLNGFEVCRILQMYEDTKRIPVFAVTVLNSPNDVKKIKSCGVKEYIPKPVDIEKLIKLIKNTFK